MDELATRIAAIVRPDAIITRGDVDPRDADRYHSDGRDWERYCQRWGFVSTPLDHQIELTAHGVLGRTQSADT